MLGAIDMIGGLTVLVQRGAAIGVHDLCSQSSQLESITNFPLNELGRSCL